MQFLTTTLSLLSLSSVAFGCTRRRIKFFSAEYACADDQAAYNSDCINLQQSIAEFSASHWNMYGSEITQTFTGCDACGDIGPRCYCTVTAWRYREWLATPDRFAMGPWELSEDWTAIDGKTVDCKD